MIQYHTGHILKKTIIVMEISFSTEKKIIKGPTNFALTLLVVITLGKQ